MAKSSGFIKGWTGKKGSKKSDEHSHRSEEVSALREELQEARRHVLSLQQKAELDGNKITKIETYCMELQNEKRQWEEGRTLAEDMALLNSSLRAKAEELEFSVKQLNVTIEQLEKELQESRSCKDKLGNAMHDLQEALAEIEQLRAERNRGFTRSRLQELTGERGVREELAKLQKEFLKLEFTAKKEKAEAEAKLGLARDNLKKMQEKANNAQKQVDVLEKDKIDLQIENRRLEKRQLGSLGIKSREKIEEEAKELEIQNLRRTNQRLQKCMSLTGSMMALDTMVEADSYKDDSSLAHRISPPDANCEVQMKKLTDRQRKLEEELNKSQTIILALKERLKRAEKTLEAEREDSLHIRAEYDKLKNYLDAGDKCYIDEISLKISELKSQLEFRDEEFQEKERDLKARNRNLQSQLDALFDNGGQLPDGMKLDEEDEEVEEDSVLKEKIAHLEEELKKTKGQKQALEERIAREEKEVEELAASLTTN